MVKSDPPTGPFVEGKRTAKLRPNHGFNTVQVGQIRKQKKEGLDNNEIAVNMNSDVHRVKLVLSALRTKRIYSNRKTINVGNSAGRFIESEKKNGEATWETMDRILTELQELRARR